MSRRRADDPEDFDASERRRNGRENGPWWLKALAWIGLPGFLVLFLLGAIPGLPSPLLGSQIKGEALSALTEDFRRHERTTKAQLHLLRLICRGVWKDGGHNADEIQRQCDTRGGSENP